MDLLWCLSLVLVVQAQRTYRRTCDCEYTVDGKCAYTLLLPQADSCPTSGGDQANLGPGNDMTADTLDNLERNVSALWSTNGEQSRMLNQLQSMLLTQQQALTLLQQSNMSAPAPDIPEYQIQEARLLTLEHDLDTQRSRLIALQELLTNNTQLVKSLSEDLESLQTRVNATQEVLRRHFLCSERGLLVSGSQVNISDEMMSASSQFNENHQAPRGRINTRADDMTFGAWCPGKLAKTA